MRNPGERSADRVAGRQKGPAGRNGASSGRPAGASPQPAPGGSSLFVPGYSGDQPAAGEPGRHAAARPGGGWYGPTAGMAGKGPVRGFPPAPGQPPPVYPPGQFSAWNRSARPAADGYPDPRQEAVGRAASGYPEAPAAGSAGPWYPEPGYARLAVGELGAGQPGYAEPAYSVLAVSDPAADVTSTQSWEALDASLATSSRAARRAPLPEPPLTEPSLTEPLQADHWQPAADLVVPPPQQRQAGQAQRPAADWAGHAQRAAADWAGQADRPAADWAGQADRLAADRSGRARPDTGGHRYQAAQPGSDRRTGEAGRLAAPPRGPAARTERPQPRRAHARARGRSGRKRAGRLLLACGLIVAIVVATAAYVWFDGGHHGAGQAAAAPNRSASVPSQPPPATQLLGRWGHIESRTADPLPLTLTELFPASFSAGGSGYARTVERDGTDCAKAVIGSALQSALRLGKCTQVMRASYFSQDSKLMGTIGVLNLASVVATERSGKAAGGGDFIAQLAAAKGPTRHLTMGTGIEETEIKGHFLVMVWAEFASLHAPTAKWQRLDLETFCNRLIQNTANLSLASRMITGKPRTP